MAGANGLIGRPKETAAKKHASGIASDHTFGMIRVFLLDDHDAVRGLRNLLEATGEMTVVGEAASVAEALERIPSDAQRRHPRRSPP